MSDIEKIYEMMQEQTRKKIELSKQFVHLVEEVEKEIPLSQEVLDVYKLIEELKILMDTNFIRLDGSESYILKRVARIKEIRERLSRLIIKE
jgi:hypothetical protein